MGTSMYIFGRRHAQKFELAGCVIRKFGSGLMTAQAGIQHQRMGRRVGTESRGGCLAEGHCLAVLFNLFRFL